MKLFNNPKKEVWFIVAFLALFFGLMAYNARAESRLEFGTTYTSTFVGELERESSRLEFAAGYTGEFNGGVGMVFTERFKGKYDIGLALIGEQEWETKWGPVSVEPNGNVFAQRIVKTPAGRFEAGLGAGYWIKAPTRITGCNLAFTMSLRWNITQRIPLTVRHWSNAGSCPPNRGQDLLSIGWRF